MINMCFLSYKEFLNETETVKLDKELREYVLTHVKDDRFQLKSKDYYKEFSVLPYKSEILNKLHVIQDELAKAVESHNIQQLYRSVTDAERISYPYGNTFTSHFSLSSIPELTTTLEPDQQRDLATSEREFLLNQFASLGQSTKDEILEALRERAEILCAVIEALFYYVRTIDKDKFYDGLSREEIIDEYKTAISDASKKESFSFDGPFGDNESKIALDSESRTAFWYCEKNMKKFFIQGTISPKELYAEENVGGTKGIKLSLSTTEDKNPPKDYSFFEKLDLANRIKSFYTNILKK